MKKLYTETRLKKKETEKILKSQNITRIDITHATSCYKDSISIK